MPDSCADTRAAGVPWRWKVFALGESVQEVLSNLVYEAVNQAASFLTPLDELLRELNNAELKGFCIASVVYATGGCWPCGILAGSGASRQ
jgi:hypothetical protein